MRGGMVRQGKGKPVALSTACQGDCSSAGRHLTSKAAQLQAQRGRDRDRGRGGSMPLRDTDRDTDRSQCSGTESGKATESSASVPVPNPRSWSPSVSLSLERFKLSGLRSPFARWHALTANRYPLTADTFAFGPYFPSAALIDFTTALPRTAEPSALKCTSALFWCWASVGVIAALRSSIATSFSFMTLSAMSL